jgi:hypothetical protein
VALKVQRAHQRFVSWSQDSPNNPCPEAVRLIHSQSGHFGSGGDVDKVNTSGEHGPLVSPFIPRQRLLWATVSRDQEWVMWMYNFNKDSYESLIKQCNSLAQWHNARWALLSSIVAQKLGLFHNQQWAESTPTKLCATIRFWSCRKWKPWSSCTSRPPHAIITPAPAVSPVSPVCLTWLIWRLLGIANQPGN